MPVAQFVSHPLITLHGSGSLESWLPFVLFALVASITPGPTNILVLSHSARLGLIATLPIILSACTAAAGIVLAAGLGVGAALLDFPRVQQAMMWGGVAWLTWLAWQIHRSAAPSLACEAAPGASFGARSAALLQVVNPKVWMMAVAVVSVFASGSDQPLHLAALASVFLLVSLPCMTFWAMLGAGSAKVLRSPLAVRWINTALALLLLISAWSSLLM